MRAVTWQGHRSLEVADVPAPRIEQPTDAIIRVTATAVCGSDLHLYELLGAFIEPGDILGHEPMGIVTEVGPGVSSLAVGDRVVVPFPIACGSCAMCLRGLHTQCETTQNRDHGMGASLFGYTSLYGSVPGGQAEYLRVPLADATSIRIDGTLPDERYLFLSDIIPTAWQAVEYAELQEGETLLVLGLGPVGQLAARVGRLRGARVIGVDPVPERRAMAARHGVRALDVDELNTVVELTEGRGADRVVDAVGTEASGNPVVKAAQVATARLPKAIARPVLEATGVDRLQALHTAIDLVRRGGTVSLAGVYVGDAGVLPVKTMFDKQLTLRMGQCNVQRWIDELLPIVEDPEDPLGLSDLVTHRGTLDDAPRLYELFQKKEDGCIKVVLYPEGSEVTA